MYRLYSLLALALIASCAHKQSQPQIGSSHAALTSDQYSTLTYEPCSAEWQTCSFPGTRVVRFGAPGSYVYVVATGSVMCRYDVLGDPLPGKTKSCSVSTVDPTAEPPEPPPEMDAGTGCCCCCNGKPVDAGVVFDGGVDAGSDAGVDAGVDAGNDAGVADAGPADSGQADTGTPAGETAPRPSYSKGRGFYVVGSKLFDGNGNRVILRGSNRTHIDSQSKWYGQTASNATRSIIDPEPWIPFSYERTLQAMTDHNMGGTTANGKDIQIPGMWKGTCSSDLGLFETMVQRWVSTAARFQASSEHYMILNIANEALSDELVFRDKYIDAVKRIRAAGWNGAFMIDAPGCGQKAGAIVRHGKAILDADPQRNVVFSWHIYGLVYDTKDGIAREWRDAEMDLEPMVNALAATGLAVVIGEFGPGRCNIGGSPTCIRPERILELADARGFGSLSWSIDDHNRPNEGSDDNGFGHSRDQTLGNLTIFGKLMVDYWAKHAKTASIFGDGDAVAAPAALRRAASAAGTAARQPIKTQTGKKLH